MPSAGAEAGAAPSPPAETDIAGDAEVAAVRAHWTRLGLPGLVDVHVHFMPKPVMDKVWAYFDAAGPLVGTPWPIAYRTDEADRLARLRAFGVRAVPSLVYPHKPGMAAWLNQWSAGFAAGRPQVLQSATFYPEPEAAAYVTDALDAGAPWKCEGRASLHCIAIVEAAYLSAAQNRVVSVAEALAS